MTTHVIVNPASGSGRTGREWAGMKKRLANSIGHFEAHLSEYPEHATLLTRQALLSGAKRIIVVGGDGSLSEVVNGFFEDSHIISEDAILAIIFSGTGGDFAHALGLSHNLDEQIALLERGTIRRVDVGLIDCHDNRGQPTQHYFINECSIGMAANIAAQASKTPLSKRIAGRYAYLLAALHVLLRPVQWRVRITTDNGIEQDMDIALAVFMNGVSTGGGLRLVPDSHIDDGLLECVTVAPIRLSEVIRWIPKLYTGGIYQHPAFRHFSASSVTIAPESKDNPLKLEADGEARWQTPATIRLLKQALPVISGDLQ